MAQKDPTLSNLLALIELKYLSKGIFFDVFVDQINAIASAFRKYNYTKKQ